RRTGEVRIEYDPVSASWWEASTYGPFSQLRFELNLRTPSLPGAAEATFWIMDPFSAAWGVHAVGLIQLAVKPEVQRQGAAIYLIGEAFHHLRLRGVSLVEAQTMVYNTAARNLYAKLGFTEVDQGA